MSRKDECGGYEVRLCRGTHWHVTICGHDIIGTYQTEAEAWEAARRLHVREDLDNGPANSPEVSQNPAKYQPTPSTEGEQAMPEGGWPCDDPLHRQPCRCLA